MKQFVRQEIIATQELMQVISQDEALHEELCRIAEAAVAALRNGHKILFAGNGGSAADAQHLAAELVSRLCYDRPGLAGIALTTDTSALTAIGNDYSFEKLFSRQVEALGQPGDMLLGISTSGKSPNILQALATAKKQQMTTVGLTGRQAPLMQQHCDFLLNVPSTSTQKIQEGHIVLGHILCGLIEEAMFGATHNPARMHKPAEITS